ncbi:hypothetical protein EKO23_10690 [Nocardioides guangzhouensis]|uniref:Uncharacterized protein n=1 Tax=Nocardioides guangzhouensis TaxID=2497878 RepID=A0A4Q4ZEB1_9ACTN|nr:PD40 domain-containing protein [Nocardioides guangzhouensis]RYP86078.1 hypothetical protein EKO23_10690 [Nocardioides guangzhouensis]
MILRALAGAVVAALVAAPLTVVAPADATWSGSNGYIVFVGSSPKGRDLFRIHADGTGRQRLTRLGHVSDPRYNRAGSRIAFTYGGVLSRDVWVMRANGSDPTPVITGGANESQPSWSPDGRRIAYTSDESGKRQIHVLDLVAGTSTQITSASATLDSAWSPAWSPNGRRIAFVGRVPTGQDPDEVDLYHSHWNLLMTVEPDGANPTAITDSYWVARPDWVPSGRRILFSFAEESYRNECYVHARSIAANGSESAPTRLATTGCFEYDPVRSPDNRRMALWSTGRDYFSSHPRIGLYVARASGAGQRRIAPDARRNLGIDWQAR